MPITKYLLALFSPRASRELALSHSVLTALAINALNGALIMPICFHYPDMEFLSMPLMLLIAILFGPYASLILSTIYPRIEYWVGGKLGSKAEYDDLYRIFAWSFLPAGLACFLAWLIIALLPGTFENISRLAVLVPSLVLLCLAFVIYGFNVISIHQLPKTKGLGSILITLGLFAFLPTGLIVLFSMIIQLVKQYGSRYRRNEDKDLSTSVRRAGIAIVVFYVALFSWIVFFDEKPDPQVSKALNTSVPDVLRSDNAWLAFLAFTSPAEGPPFVKEEKMLRDIKAAMLKSDGNACREDASEKKDAARLSFKGKIPELYARKDNGIWEYVSAHNTEVDQFLRDNKELLERYNTLYSFHQYAEPLDYGILCIPIPQFAPLRNTQKLKLMQITRIARQGDFHGALSAVQKDAEFWRFIARESKTLISKLISISALSSDIRFVAELGAHHRFSLKEWETVRSILRPFDQGESSMKTPLEGEARLSMYATESLFQGAKKDPFLVHLLLKPNATRNRMYSSLQKDIELSEKSPRELASEVTRENTVNSPISAFSFIYNPVGEILAAVGKPNISGFIERGHNLEGLRRLAILKVLSNSENVAPENMQQFLDAHKGDYGNPYTGAPMRWDAQKMSIFFKQPREEKLVEVIL